jgi:anti-sigma factor RsiW
MTCSTCVRVRRHLSGYHDRELTVRDMCLVRAHLEGCPRCADEVARLERLGEVLRGAASQVDLPYEEIARLAKASASRVEAEREQSVGARIARAFEDMHLVWAALAATSATALCAALLVGLAYVTPQMRSDSLAGMLSALAAPGSDRFPVSIDERMIPPRVVEEPTVTAFAEDAFSVEDDIVFALAAVVTQEGRVVRPSVLKASAGDHEDVTRLMRTVSEARFRPASYAGAPVAVNMVWVVTHTTVRGKTIS